MASARQVVSEEPNKLTQTDAKGGSKPDEVKAADKPKPDDKTTNATAAPVAKRTPGTKEVIPFEWKLIGEANKFVLTLFKAVEREEVEAQMERLQKDKYYSNLQIVGNLEVVKQPRAAGSPIPVRKGDPPPGSKKEPKKKKVLVAKQPQTIKVKKATKSKTKAKSAKTSKKAATKKTVRSTKATTAKTSKVAKKKKTTKKAKAPAKAKSTKKKTAAKAVKKAKKKSKKKK